MSRRVAHLISEFSAHEAMGRTITETVQRLPGEHHLITTRVHDGGDAFASVTRLGDSLTRFPSQDPARLAAVLDHLDADVVHLHAGVLGPFLAARAGLRDRPVVLTVYAWPNLPGAAAWRHAGWRGLRSSNVLPNRVLATAALPPAVVRRGIAALAPAAVLTPDPRVAAKLAGHRAPGATSAPGVPGWPGVADVPAVPGVAGVPGATSAPGVPGVTGVAGAPGVPVIRLPAGGAPDPRRAGFDARDGRPTIVFAGRAEKVRGVATLIDAFPQVLAAVPAARLKLLLLPRAELAGLRHRVAARHLGAAVDLRTSPIADLPAHYAAAQVGAWPFLADYTTSPPALAPAEALATGLPVVATPVACLRPVVGRDDALIVPPGDRAALAGALTLLLTNRAAWQHYARAALTAAGRLSWQAVATATETAYLTTRRERLADAP